MVYPVSVCSVRFWMRYYGVLNRKLLSFASVLQVYAIINAICGLFLALRMADDYYSGAVGFLLFGTVLVASGFIYALGEVIKLLHEIKLNTRKTEK